MSQRDDDIGVVVGCVATILAIVVMCATLVKVRTIKCAHEIEVIQLKATLPTAPEVWEVCK